MDSMINTKRTSQYLIPVGLIFGFVFTYFEITVFIASKPGWEKLVSPAGLIAIGLYILLLLAGVTCLLLGAVVVATLNRFARSIEKTAWLRGMRIVVLTLIIAWVYLYSPWQNMIPGPWGQLIFAAGFAQIALLLLAPQREQVFGWSELSLAFVVFLYPHIVHEVRSLTSIAIAYRGVTVGGLVFVLVLAFVLYFPFGDWLKSELLSLRARMGRLRLWIAAFFWLMPLFYRYLFGAEIFIVYVNIYFAVLLVILWFTAYLTCSESDRLVSWDMLGVNFGALILVSAITSSLLLVIDYPFSLSWSEGNRFYDYSLVFGQKLYNYTGSIFRPYSSPGRYGLWGALFLWDGLSISAHRLWNIVLQTVPTLFFSYLITRKLTPAALRYGMLLWITLFFLVIAPLHPPFMLVSILVVLFAFDESVVKRGVFLVIASYYASLTRWTWVFAPAAMGALIDLILYYPYRQGKWLKRILPTILLVIFAVLPGIVESLGRYLSFFQKGDLTSQQPLLWYRLLPNNTLGPGVLFMTLYTTGPLVVLLIWWIASRRWDLDITQKFAVFGALSGFFGVGLVISTKIGGGGDLHNLDMYLVTLMVVASLAMMKVQTSRPWPAWTVVMVLLLILVPVYRFTPLSTYVYNGTVLTLPKQSEIKKSLTAIRKEVSRAVQQGDVLFMDQRQLLTFGYVDAIPLIPEYEKKYMMDQAMASNGNYFKPYYQDLANKRFTLIVTEPLRSKLQGEMGGQFSEENDAWVTWVSNPTLCFYEPIYLSRTTDVELLIPRENPVGCEEYLK